MAKYKHRVSGVETSMTKDDFKKLPEGIRKKYVEIPSPSKKKPKEAEEPKEDKAEM